VVANHQGCQHQEPVTRCTPSREDCSKPDVQTIGWIFVACLTAQTNFDADSAKVLGIWKLVSLKIEVQGTGQMEPPMGEKPTGYAVFTQEGRAFFILTGELRERATNDEERAELLNTLVAYTGTYRVEGDRWNYQSRSSLESRMGRLRTNAVFQTGRRPTTGIVTVAGDAELARQRDDPQHPHL